MAKIKGSRDHAKIMGSKDQAKTAIGGCRRSHLAQASDLALESLISNLFEPLTSNLQPPTSNL
jgi:hypothetical protein